MVGQDAYHHIRQQFEYFKPDNGYPAFMENAGGSQVPDCVAEAVYNYFRHSYAQLGAGHAISSRATETVVQCKHWMRTFANAPESTGSIILGSSSSSLLRSLADIYAQALKPGDEVVVQELSHETNISPWLHAAAVSGATVRWWQHKEQADSRSRAVEELAALLGPATRLVALTHVSNLIGIVNDLPDLVKCIRELAPLARIVVDGVAYAPHRCLDMQTLGVDWYVFSTYKVYGPHMAVLFGAQPAIRQLQEAGASGANHFFVPSDDFAYKFELGGVNHEGCAGLLALQAYFKTLADLADQSQASSNTGVHTSGDQRCASGAYTAPTAWLSRERVVQAFDLMRRLEQERLISYLESYPGVILLGKGHSLDAEHRVPTISFVHTSLSPQTITKQLQERGFAVRHGHMYAARLVKRWVDDGVIPSAPGGVHAAYEAGVTRISLLHYNTPDEVEQLITALSEVLLPA